MPLVEKMLTFCTKKKKKKEKNGYVDMCMGVWCVHLALKAGRGLCFAAGVGDICRFPAKGLGV